MANSVYEKNNLAFDFSCGKLRKHLSFVKGNFNSCFLLAQQQ